MLRPVKWTGFGPIKKGDCLSYGDFKDCKDWELEGMNPKDYYYLSSDMEGSDYSGGLRTKSNYDVFLKCYGKYAGIQDVWGGFGTYAVAIRADVQKRHPEIKEVLDGLESYGLIDEEDFSNQEHEAKNKAWDDWAEQDVITIIRDVLKDEDWEPSKDFPDGLRYAFEMALETTRDCWEMDTNGSAWISVDEAAKAIAVVLADRTMLKRTPNEDLPLLMTHKWSLESIRQDFLKRLELA